ncbi:MAG: endonuclease/exonuclease/phosphatase family protein [Verrucomicrobiae bacterium]
MNRKADHLGRIRRRQFSRGIAIALTSLLGITLGALPSRAKDIVVASYNLQNYLKMERRVDGKSVPEAAKPAEEIAAAIEIIQKIAPDVLGLVEMGDDEMLKDFQARLKACGSDFPYREWVAGADPDRHLAVLSRHPIVARNSRDDVPFELGGTRQRIARGILDVTVQLGATFRLRLVGAHLKSRRQIPDFDEKTLRAKEAWLIRKHLDGILEASPGSNVLLFGDLNDTKNEYPVKELIGSPKSPGFMRDLFLTDRHGYRWTHFWSVADVYSRIDYLLVSPRLWPKIAMSRSGISNAGNWFKASDHRAIYAAIQIPQE